MHSDLAWLAVAARRTVDHNGYRAALHDLVAGHVRRDSLWLNFPGSPTVFRSWDADTRVLIFVASLL